MADRALIVIGSSHHTAPLDLLESLALTPEEAGERVAAMNAEARALYEEV